MIQDVLQKITSKKLRNVSEFFSIELDKKEQEIKFSNLNNVKIVFKAQYPLDLIFDEQALIMYNRIYKFLLEIQKAKFSLIVNK